VSTSLHSVAKVVTGTILFLGLCLTVLTMTPSRSGAAVTAPSYSATGVCVGGVSEFSYTFYGLPQGVTTTATLSIFDSPDQEATGTPVTVGPGVTTVLWNIPSPLFHAGQHVIAVHVGSTGLPATNLTAVSPWPISNSYAITLPSCGTSPLSFVALASTPDDQGYWQAAADGQVLGFGDARTNGSMSGVQLNHPIVGMASTPDGNGYWLVASDGGVFSFGDAPFYGSTGGMMLNKPIVGMVTTTDGKGYYLVGSDGGVFAFGDAIFRGSTGAMRLNQPVVGMALDSNTGGYWLAASDGGVFSFSAPFLGSTGGIHLNRPVVGMETQTGTGYRLVANDGGVFSFGNSSFAGSLGTMPPSQPIVGVSATSDDLGYTMIGGNGAIYPFGNAANFGSVSGAAIVPIP
jgi:hypothetical protein